MPLKVLIAHAEGEDARAEELAAPIREAGYEVWHQGMVLAGESITEESSKALSTGAPVILCGTERTMARGYAHRFVNAARARNSRVSIFPVRMDEYAYVEVLSYDAAVAEYWRDPGEAVSELLDSLKKHYPLAESAEPALSSASVEDTYRRLALESFDIIDLDNLPDVDRATLGRRIDFRRLYVTLRVQEEAPSNFGGDAGRSRATERLAVEANTLRGKEKEKHNGVPVGRELAAARQLVILGDAGSGKTTMLRWIATAYLLRAGAGDGWKNFPDIETLPKENWLPIIIRCREIERSGLPPPLEDLLRHTLRRLEIPLAEVDVLSALLMRKLAQGEALLLVDGLDEITDPAMRADFCKQLEGIHLANKLAPIIVTSRAAGYREMGCRIGRGFKHLVVSDLSKEDKDYFARQWCSITVPPGERERAAGELIEEIHSTDRIERLTRNPMLLTTMALVKRKGGKLPGNRVDLYWAALEVLLNWRSRVDKPLDWRETGPQLEYLAFAMCDRGVQQLREDEVISLLDSLRSEFPSLYSVQAHTPDEFLRLLERRTGILVQAGSETFRGREVKLYEFRHLTFQEYLAAMALVDGYYPAADGNKNLAEVIAPLAGRTIEKKEPEPGPGESVVTENWREAIRLCVTICDYRDVDGLFRAVLQPLEGENPQTVGRPRAVLAALCLADDPNGVTREAASEVLSALVGNLGASDGRSFEDTSEGAPASLRTSLDAAVQELARSRWAGDAARLLVEEFRRRGALARRGCGFLAGAVASPDSMNPGEAAAWLEEQTSRITSGDEGEAVAAALSIRAVASRREVYATSGMVGALLGMLTGSGPSAHAAALALDKLNEKDELGWKPLSSQLAFCSALVGEPSFDRGAVIRLSRLLGREGDRRAVGALVSRLGDARMAVRRAAVVALGKIKDAGAVGPVLERLGDKESGVRKAAAKALGLIKDERAVGPLIGLLNDENVPVRAAALNALGFFSGEGVEASLVSATADPSPAIRAAALNSLSEIDCTRHVEYLLAGTDDESGMVRLAAVQGIVDCLDPRVEGVLMSKLDDADSEIRSYAALELGLLKSSRATELLISKLDDESEAVQSMAAYSLGIMADVGGSESMIPSLLGKITGGAGDVRASAAGALRNIDDDEKIAPLLGLLNDNDSEVRAEALYALGGSDRPDVLKAVIRKLEDESDNVRAFACEALGESRSPLAVKPLLLRLEDVSAEVRADAAEALGNLGSELAVEPLLSMLGDAVPGVRIEVVQALGKLRDERALPALLAALEDPHTYIRPFVVNALGEFGGEAVVRALSGRLEEESGAVRAAIVEALGEIEDEAVEPILRARLDDPAVAVREAAGEALRDVWFAMGLARFDAGDVTGAAANFENIVRMWPKGDNMRNNIVFCSLLAGQYAKAAEHAALINFDVDNDERPLWQLNYGLLAFLTGEEEAAVSRLKTALRWLGEAEPGYDPAEVYSILLLKERSAVSSFKGIPVDAAIIINLYLMGAETLDDTRAELSERYPSECDEWESLISQLEGQNAERVH